MTQTDITAPAPAPPSARLLRTILMAALAMALGFVGGWAFEASGVGRSADDAAMRDFILANPEVLPQAMENLARKESLVKLDGVGGQARKPFPGAILGNPQGKVTLVEFSDYACGYCRASVAEVNALIAANPELKVVVRELPILSPESADAARMALAAARQGKFAAFHAAMFAKGRPNAATIAAAAQKAGLDIAKANAFAASPAADAELRANVRIAQELGFNGTPSWIAGREVLAGAVGRARLADALATREGARKTDGGA